MRNRVKERLWKLVCNDKLKPPIPAKSKKSIEAELEFYQFKGGRTKSVRDRISRLEEAISIIGE